jgi:hypothetical protein
MLVAIARVAAGALAALGAAADAVVDVERLSAAPANGTPPPPPEATP